MAVINCIIVDDDRIIRLEIEQMVQKTPFLNLVKSCSNGKEALSVISSSKIDLLFLDVMMPEMSGLELIKSLTHNKPQVILITADKKYALDAFEYDVTDFLSKPISPDRFWKAVTKAKEHHELKKQSSDADNYFFAKVDSKLIKIVLDDILYIESFGDYLHIHTAEKRHTIHSTMKAMISKLPEHNFVRVHNSYTVRIDKISSIEDSTLIINKNLIPISRSYHDELMARLNLVSDRNFKLKSH